jgi:abhydrolase domain-containing protein 13
MGIIRALLRLVRITAFGVGGLTSLGFAALVVFQRKLVYVPSLPGAPRQLYQFQPERFGLTYEELWLTTKDGVRLHAWLCASRHTGLLRGPTVLFLQENAGNISHRLQNVKALVERLACNVLIVSYRGCAHLAGGVHKSWSLAAY